MGLPTIAVFLLEIRGYSKLYDSASRPYGKHSLDLVLVIRFVLAFDFRCTAVSERIRWLSVFHGHGDLLHSPSFTSSADLQAFA